MTQIIFTFTRNFCVIDHKVGGERERKLSICDVERIELMNEIREYISDYFCT